MARSFQNDRFGNKYIIVGCKENKNGFAVGYAEIGGKLYKIEPSSANKDGIKAWVKLTQIKKQGNMSF